MRLWLGTSNAGKLREFDKLLGILGHQIKQGPFLEVEEDGETFEANALKKAEALWMLVGEPCLADDSGLLVDALDGAPGVRSARYADDLLKNHKDWSQDQRNRHKLLRSMRAVPEQDRSARFVSVVALCQGPGRVETFTGECTGTIAPQELGLGGFGYDAVFIPTGQTQTFAQLSQDFKNAHSHRAHALAKLATRLARAG